MRLSTAATAAETDFIGDDDGAEGELRSFYEYFNVKEDEFKCRFLLARSAPQILLIKSISSAALFRSDGR